ncbi:MAG TPA: GNAT family N-acetyltransferase, partial [Methylomirabilota bacterium]|nr:GNAT family N-acetyltransferase [Methylomirabilota bacterium]
MADALEIHPLTPQRLPDLAALFGQGGDPKWCWCASFRVRSLDFTKADPAANRQVLERAMRTTAQERRAPGLIAYRDGEAIGWVSLGPRDDYERLRHSKVLAPVDDSPAWSI